ncbi:MAG: hypothetical protein ACFFB5_05770 [Promethearchaeota archaeon]
MVERQNDKIDLKKIEQQTFHEFMIDGITEILLGIVLIFLPILFIHVSFITFYVCFILFAQPIVEFIRERTTYPRLGRVEFKREEDKEGYSMKKSLLILLLLFLASFVITLSMMIIVEGEFDLSLIYKWIPFLFGLIMFGPSIFLVGKTNQQRYYFLGAFSTILGFFFAMLDFPDEMIGLYLYFFTLGVSAIILGVIRYIRFVRNYPVIHMEEEKS